MPRSPNLTAVQSLPAFRKLLRSICTATLHEIKAEKAEIEAKTKEY